MPSRGHSTEILLPDIAFLSRHGIDGSRLHEAARLARLWDVNPLDALIGAGLAAAETVGRAVAAEAGLPFLADGFAVHPLARYPESLASGVAPLAPSAAGPSHVIAPRGDMMADLLRRREAPRGLALTTPAALRRAVFAARGEAIARHAAEDLVRRRPEDSFHGGLTLGQLAWSHALCLAGGAVALQAGGTAWAAALLLFGLPFLGLAAIKLAATLERVPTTMPPVSAHLLDADLPVYTVLVPLYRERRVLPALLAALAALRYPAAKLDVKLLVEAGDRETLDALSGLSVPPFADIVEVPPGKPLTKPRALNVGLALARGRFVVVYDAEDVPDPGQLRDAVALFERCEPEVACLQARLVIDNTADSWLTRFFTVEYGALFDVVNPALARFDLPMPLGGTSNHLKTDILRRLGGWDPWNVTEDADLGIRLAAEGYRVVDLPSATLEEAPATLPAWMAQRARWMKGLVQVTITHSRRPLRNAGRLGVAKLLAAISLVFGAVASALVYPFFTALVAWALVAGTFLEGSGLSEVVSVANAAILVFAGLLAMTLPPLVAIARRGWWPLWPYALGMPLYYGLVSVAAWRGLIELLADPDRWNKTEHGLARTSRRTSSAQS